MSSGANVGRAATALAMLVALAAPLPAAAVDGPAGASEAAAAVSKVEPAEFGAGATITITGSGFEAGDIVMLDSVKLEDVTVTPTKVTATVPARAKTGKKLIVKRGSKKLAELPAPGFVPAPKLTTVTPKFAAPGETVTLKGKNLARVTATLGGEPLTLTAQGETALSFVAAEGMQTGTLAVQGVGGEAALKKDYEIFYAPTLTKLEPAAAFEGDSVVVSGAHLGEGVKFKLTKKPLKASAQSDASATLTVAKGSKSGPLRAEARKKGAELPFTVHPTPLLTTVPKEVGAPGTLKVSGKNLDAVTTWRLGQVSLTPAEGASKSKVTLTLPADAPTDQTLVAVTQGREFPSKKPVAVLRVPVAEALAYWPDADGKGVTGEIRGRDFASVTKFKLAGKSLKTTFVDAERVTFALPVAPKPKAQELAAKSGKYTGPTLAVDGAAGGYRFAPAEFDAQLASKGQDYPLAAVLLDLEVSANQPGRGTEALKAAGKAATGPEGQADAAALGERIALDLRRFTIAQVGLCSQMAPGKEKDKAAANAALGEALRAAQKQQQALAGQLRDLWSGLPAAATEAGAASGLSAVDAQVAAALSARAQVDAACKGKYHGRDKLVSEAAQTARVDLDALYRGAVTAAFTEVLAKGKSWGAVEPDVNARLAALPAARRSYWQTALKASKSAVEGSAAGVTGKGARGDKHVEKQGKPTAPTGKGKGK